MRTYLNQKFACLLCCITDLCGVTHRLLFSLDTTD